MLNALDSIMVVMNADPAAFLGKQEAQNAMRAVETAVHGLSTAASNRKLLESPWLTHGNSVLAMRATRRALTDATSEQV